MSEYNSKQKKNLLKKLKAINMTNEKRYFEYESS